MSSSLPSQGTQGQPVTTPIADPSSPAQQSPPPQPFLDPIPDIIPFGSICMLAGASGVGKTALLSEWAKRFIDGRQICHRTTNAPTGIGIIVGDRRWKDHRKWFVKAGFPYIANYSFRDDHSFNWDTGFITRAQCASTFRRCLDRMGAQPGWIIILDPLALFIPGNLNDYKTCAAGIGSLDKVILERQITVLGLAHMGKQKGNADDRYTRPQDRILGSTALLAFSDTPMYLLGPDIDDNREEYEFGWIPHHSPQEQFLFKRNDKGLFVPVYRTPKDIEDVTKVLELIPAGEDGIATKELESLAFEHLGMSRPTVQRRLQLLDQMGQITRRYGHVTRRKHPTH